MFLAYSRLAYSSNVDGTVPSSFSPLHSTTAQNPVPCYAILSIIVLLVFSSIKPHLSLTHQVGERYPTSIYISTVQMKNDLDTIPYCCISSAHLYYLCVIFGHCQCF